MFCIDVHESVELMIFVSILKFFWNDILQTSPIKTIAAVK